MYFLVGEGNETFIYELILYRYTKNHTNIHYLLACFGYWGIQMNDQDCDYQLGNFCFHPERAAGGKIAVPCEACGLCSQQQTTVIFNKPERICQIFQQDPQLAAPLAEKTERLLNHNTNTISAESGK